MVVPPFHTLLMIIFSRKTPWLVRKPTILGNPHFNSPFRKKKKKKKQLDYKSTIRRLETFQLSLRFDWFFFRWIQLVVPKDSFNNSLTTLVHLKTWWFLVEFVYFPPKLWLFKLKWWQLMDDICFVQSFIHKRMKSAGMFTGICQKALRPWPFWGFPLHHSSESFGAVNQRLTHQPPWRQYSKLICMETGLWFMMHESTLKSSYFTNLDFPEIRWCPFLSYLLGWGRVTSL